MIANGETNGDARCCRDGMTGWGQIPAFTAVRRIGMTAWGGRNDGMCPE